jgi:ABC-type nitrate/sulfonate/bicarbonate transport system substrate-binding protein
MRLVVNSFPGGFNWPLFVACDTGLFAREGLAVEVQATAGSIAQMTDFAAGRCDIVLTAFDNIVAYVDGEGEAPIGAQPEFFAFVGCDSSFLNLVTTARIAAYDDLRGERPSVDAATTGYAFVLYEMLRRRGLVRGVDYQEERVGGTLQRFADLKAGGHPATMMSSPYDVLGLAEGFRRLDRAIDVIGPYQGNVAAARRSWAARNEPAMLGFARAWLAAIDWLYAPQNRNEALEILQRNVAGMSAELARASAAIMLDPADGFFRDGQLRADGVATVLALRKRYIPGCTASDDATRYTDMRYWEAARGRNVAL